MIKYDETEVKEQSELVADGIYEGVIKMEMRTSLAGKNYISIQVRIRDDIEQGFKNRVIFDMITKDKNNENEFVKWKVFKILKAIDCPNNKEFGDYEEYMDFVTGKFLRIKVGNKLDNYANKNKNYIADYMITENPANTLEADLQEIQLPEEDIPF